MLNGYDIDGVLLPYNGAEGLVPQEPYIIVSGRNYTQFYNTVNKLREKGIYGPILLRPSSKVGDRVQSGEWKANVINFAGVTTFYEDEDLQAEIIRKECPNCKVIMVTEGRINE